MPENMAVRNNPLAHDLLRRARLTDYHFPDRFGGFSAELTYTDGVRQAVGAVAVRAPNDVIIDIGAEENAITWLRQELSSIATQRWPFDYQQEEGRFSLTLDQNENHLLGQLVEARLPHGLLSYRIRDGRIIQFQRHDHKIRRSLDVLEYVQTEDTRILPTYFLITSWDVAANRLIQSQAYSDRFALFDGILLPASRRVLDATDAGITVRELTLAGYQLLPT